MTQKPSTIRTFRERPDMRTQPADMRWHVQSNGQVFTSVGSGPWQLSKHKAYDVTEVFARVFMEEVFGEDVYKFEPAA